MGKHLINFLLRYILFVFIFFIFFFLIILFFHILPVIKISLEDRVLTSIIQSLIFPSFYHALFNALLISIFLYGVLILNKQRNLYFPALLIPLLFSSSIVFLFLYFTKPNSQSLEFIHYNDARLYFSAQTFFEYNDKKYYFEQIEKNQIYNCLVIENNNIDVIRACDVIFLMDKVILTIPYPSGFIEKIEFDRDESPGMKMYNSLIKINLVKGGKSLSYNFFEGKNIYINTFLWLSIGFLILSFIGTIQFHNYPFLSFTYNLLFLILFYIFFNFFYELFKKYSMGLINQPLIRDYTMSIIMFFTGIFFQILRILFVKSHLGENI